MKATITRPDGTRIEAEGTPEEITKLAGGWTDAPKAVFIQQPCARPHLDFIPAPVYPWGVQPMWPGYPFGGTTDSSVGFADALAGIAGVAAQTFMLDVGAAANKRSKSSC